MRHATHRHSIALATLLGTLGVAAAIAPAQRRGWGSGNTGNGSSATTTRATTAPADAYAIVVERNIFLRDRRPPVVVDDRPATTRPTAPPPPTLEASLVLRGVVLEDDQFHAYFENGQSNEMVRVVAGDALAKGRVADISIDAVEFETAAGSAWIKIGDNLAGARVENSTAAPTTRPAGAATNPALSSIEEKMRQRRLERGGR